MREYDSYEKLYVLWAFTFQIALIVHFAVRAFQGLSEADAL